MPPNRETRVQLSVLDRLLDDEPKKRHEAQATPSQTVARLKDALRRDLEWLLNTRALPGDTGEEAETAESAVSGYGLPDFTCLSTSEQTEALVERAIQRALEIFEPRLVSVTVKAVKAAKAEEQSYTGILHFLITGWLRMDPAPVQVSFDTRLQLARGEYRVAGG